MAFPRKENHPSSYTHLWNLGGGTGEVIVAPESFVKVIFCILYPLIPVLAPPI